MKRAWIVFVKELFDALRDRRTLLVVLLSSVAMGPLTLVLLSTLVSQLEERAQSREVVALGLEHAPTLRNYLERQTFTLKPAPADPEPALRARRLQDPVLVIAPGFEDALGRGEPPEVEVLTHSAHPPAQAGTRQLLRLLQGFQQEQATLRLALRGVAPGSLEALHIEERDLADPAARGAQLSGMLPFFVLMAMVYGLLTAALDSTAGERERGSLEPLLLNPAPVAALVAGKWAAVMALGVLIAVLGCLSFLPGQWLLRSDTLAAMFRFGAGEALAFIGLLVPLAALLGAVLMAVAIRCRTVKEAQASAGLVVFATSLAPLVPLFSQQGEAPWHLWLPVLAQVTLMGRVLKGEAVGGAEAAWAALMCAALAALVLVWLARALRQAAVR